MTRPPKVHLRDIRLHNNGGMDFPLCCANPAQGLLNLDKGRLPTAGKIEEVTCKNCLQRAPLYYPWAYPPIKEETNHVSNT